MLLHKDKKIIEAVSCKKSILSKELKFLCQFSIDSHYDDSISHLQMQCYILTSSFDYQISKDGIPYGFGLARYATPENFFGTNFTDNVYTKAPDESKELIVHHLKRVLEIDEHAIRKLIK